MKNYLICNIQDITVIGGNVLGKRVCDVCDATFPVSDDYEWKEYAELVNIYTGQWYWLDDKPVEYIPPAPPAPTEPIDETSGQE